MRLFNRREIPMRVREAPVHSVCIKFDQLRSTSVAPAPVRSVRRTSIAQTDEEMYGNASLELLRKKLQQETRQRLLTDLFNY